MCLIRANLRSALSAAVLLPVNVELKMRIPVSYDTQTVKLCFLKESKFILEQCSYIKCSANY
jgi:hypothetical protein